MESIIKRILGVFISRLRCMVRGFGSALNDCSMYLYAAGIGLIVGFDSLCFYFFFLLAVLSTITDLQYGERRTGIVDKYIIRMMLWKNVA